MVLMFSLIIFFSFFKSPPLGEKRDFPSVETTSLQQISIVFPSWKEPFSMWFPLEGKHATLRFTCFHRMETRVN